MKLKRTVLGPVLVASVAVVSGGWLLQQGATRENNVFQQARVFDEVLHRVSRDYVEQRPSDELYQMAVEGFLRELGDPHTAFMSAKEYNDLRVQTTGEYGGLGIRIAEQDGWVTVVSPLPGTPAERAGILAGDRIIEVEGESTEGWTDDDAVNVLRGPKGSPVNIKVARSGVDAPIPFTIVREEIHVQSVPASYMVEPGIGYMDLDVFAETSTSELREAIDRLRGEGMKGLILDLRANPGGLLDQGVSVSDLFLKPGQPIVETRARNPRDNVTFRASGPEVVEGLPVVVLVNEYSASAAEIVAGALQDHDRALVVGAPTFGKGSVQTLFPLSGGNFLKMTTGKWYTPVGRSIQKERKRAGDPTALVEPEPISEDGQPIPADEAVDTASRESYKTDTGRVVYGGGGIVPDLVVRPDTLNAQERAFFEAASKSGSKFSDVVFRYAVDHARQNDGLRPDFPVTQAMRDEFLRRLQEAGVNVTREQFQGAERLLDQRLAYEIARSKWGMAAASQRANMDDNVVRTVIGLLQNAPTQQSLFEQVQAMKTARR